MRATFYHYPLHFKKPAGTSRGYMLTKNSWILEIEADGITGRGEVSVIEGLSPEFTDIVNFETKIRETCTYLEQGRVSKEMGLELFNDFPSIKFGIETALLDLSNGGDGIIFKNAFSRGEQKIPINGLVWMGDEKFMKEQIEKKLKEGFTTIKMKIGAIGIEKELEILRTIRSNYTADQIILRVDANGAFKSQEAPAVLARLAELKVHSIEQPIKPGQWQEMRQLCENSPISIALDEELIGIDSKKDKIDLLETIQPPYIILKPSLHGGISGTQEWINLAEERNIGWWITSALESNIGLNAICQLAGEYSIELPQGLGTGSLYTNNIPSDLEIESGMISLKKK
ncbi:MAG: o-succinylbenzoate synthase [Flavobacteriia bacterium]